MVGGGNSAFEYVKYLTRIANKVFVLNRTNKFRMEDYKLDKIKRMDNVEIVTNVEVKKLCGKEVLSSVEILVNGKKQNLNLDGLFVAIGHEPDLEFVNFDIELDKSGFIKVDQNQKTNIDNLFACGDIVSKKFKQIITACADGARAGNSCIGE